jgi:hypothetical protein
MEFLTLDLIDWTTAGEIWADKFSQRITQHTRLPDNFFVSNGRGMDIAVTLACQSLQSTHAQDGLTTDLKCQVLLHEPLVVTHCKDEESSLPHKEEEGNASKRSHQRRCLGHFEDYFAGMGACQE